MRTLVPRVFSRRRSLLLALPLLATSSLSGSLAQPAADASAANLPAGPGRDDVVQACSQCHSLGLVTGKPRSSGEWSSIIQQMIAQGAQLNAGQVTTIHDYLAANFSTSATMSTEEALGEAATESANAKPLYPRPSGPDQWPAYGGGNANQNFSPLKQITPQNVSRLKQAWVYHYGAGQTPAGDQGLDFRFEVTPLLIGDVMYISTPQSPSKPGLKATVTALKPETGQVLWKFESPLNIHGRGLAYWPGDATTAPRLIFATDKGMVMAVDVTTGKLATDFGWGGAIDAYAGVVDEIVGESRRDSWTVPNPVTIYKNLIITAARPGEVGPPGPRGDIRAFDVKTGRQVWDFHTIPWPGEPGHEGYVGDQWRDLTGANVWSTMTLDDATGTLYATTGDANASPNVAGDQLYSSSLLAIDANTGKLKWYHQITHHDVWDWDSPTPPVLMDIHQNGKTIPAVVMTGKHSLFFEFDRRDGTPLNGFNEKPIPQPNVVPTEPFPDAPGPLARVQMTRDEVPDLVPGMKAYCQKVWDDNKTVSLPLYGRPSPDHATIRYPSSVGGPNWGGGAFIPDQHLFVINVQNRVTFTPAGGERGNMHASPTPGSSVPTASPANRGPRRGRPPAGFAFSGPNGISLSCGALPWGELVAVNVDTKKIAWRVPLGITEELGAKGLKTGTSNIGGSVATATGLVFIGATNDRHFRAFDSRTGRVLWDTTLEASGAATPMTYMGSDGKQYVVIAAGGGTSVGQKLMSDTLVAYRLP